MYKKEANICTGHEILQLTGKSQEVNSVMHFKSAKLYLCSISE